MRKFVLCQIDSDTSVTLDYYKLIAGELDYVIIDYNHKPYGDGIPLVKRKSELIVQDYESESHIS